ncbi:MAG: DUF4407 domain-containing protein [Flavobacterium sp.]|uniref:DUF4407 domain-containing protein n=1 Tax=Flavobacterium sp. TaxID=239 RepID=UPI0011F77E5A|nr:DUF4407 domain-containing protein [Flavobacterium sp.]RZJ68709.1 MAG: DUF4407 domain-containing protein [Flavobacterium sp.]
MNDQQKTPRNSLKITLSIFSGEDINYVRGAKKPARIVLAWIGVFVILIFIGCLFSAYFFFNSLMQGNVAVSLPVGIFWGLLVVNMYFLLLYTVSPAILPNKNKSSGGSNGLFTFSMLLRLGFMSLLAIITAQPLNVELFSVSVEASLQRHVKEERAKMIVSADRFLISEEVKEFHDFRQQFNLKDKAISQSDQNLLEIYRKVADDSLFLTQSDKILKKLDKLQEYLFLSGKQKEQQQKLLSELDEQIAFEIESDRKAQDFLATKKFKDEKVRELNIKLLSAITSKLKNYDDLNILLSKSNFYIKRVQLILYECPLSFLSTSCICFLFLFPILLKYQVRKLANYYERKITMEVDDVTKRYEKFKIDYAKTLRENVEPFKFSSQARIAREMDKLKNVNFSRYIELKKEIEEEYQSEVFAKYEYWMDNPFRTMRKPKPKLIMQNHIALMDLVHPKPENETD